MRRWILSLLAVGGSTCGFNALGWADDINPFAQQVSVEETVAPIIPEPETFPEVAPPAHGPAAAEMENHHGTPHEAIPHESHGTHEAHEAHGEEHHGHHEHHEHHMHHAHHGGHGGHGGHEHEEKLGNIRVTPVVSRDRIPTYSTWFSIACIR